MNFIQRTIQTKRSRMALTGFGAGAFFCILTWSGVEAFQRHSQPVPLAATQATAGTPRLGDRPAPKIELQIDTPEYEVVGVAEPAAPRAQSVQPQSAPTQTTARQPAPVAPIDRNVKLDRQGKPILVNGKPWTGEVFDYKPIRPVRTRTMKTTAYSPDHRSCGIWADGITASGKSVWMNGGKLAAADRAIPYGTILTVPGYNGNKPIQVWDRGGKIKGNRLDLLYPTHEIALRWGVQDLPVVFWEFVEAD